MNIRIANEIQAGIRVNLESQMVTAIESGPVITTGSNKTINDAPNSNF